MSTLTAFPFAHVAAQAGSLTTARGSAPAADIPVDSAMFPARSPIHSREETLMKPLDAALSPAPDRSIRPSEPRSSDEGQRGQLISAGSLRSLDTASGPGGSVASGAGSDTADSVRPAPAQAAAPAMPNFLDSQEVNAMIRKLRQSVSLWKRIQNVRVDDQRLEQVRDDLLSHQQLIR
ncbi:hypothetical protein [Arthrobacter sp. NPDC089319]|uniref:hypothetical protein n=1 Tax=Arthrobacter sp. NPDC089319 TaxID=3155915 RepID=UPI00341E5326